MKKVKDIILKKVYVLLSLLMILGLQITSFAEITPVVDRTTEVKDAIVAAVGVNSAGDVTDAQLAAITSLNLRLNGITELKSGDFSGMTGLTNLNLNGNDLSSLPDGIFEGLTALTTLRLGGNTVDPMPITISLEKVSEDQFKAVAPTGAPFTISIPISATNGSISGNTTSLTISIGAVESTAVTLTRTAETTAAVTVNIGTLPSLPRINHYGYALSKSDSLPLEVIGMVSPTDTTDMTNTTDTADTTDMMDNTDTVTNAAPVFADGSLTTRTIVENADAGVNIGNAVSATDADDDILTYTLSGINADAFSIDSDTGQLKTKSALDYETKRIYIVSVNASDGTLATTISVIISVIDVDESPYVSTILAVGERTPEVRDAIVAAIPSVSAAEDVTETHLAAITSLSLRTAGISELKTGDFSGLIGLTNLNLYGNMLERLPSGIFEGLSSLTTLRLGGNLADPMPLIVSLQQVAADQFQAIVHTGAPFNIVLPIGVTNGITSNGETTITIPQGSVKSDAFTVVSTATLDAIGVSIGTLPSLPTNHFGYILARSAVCNRTSQVADAIAAAISSASDCNNVTDVDLATITSLDLSDLEITSLKAGDFSGLLSLSTLNLSNNLLESLPDEIFEGLTSLTSLDLSGNTVAPLPLTISLEKVGENLIKAAVATGAPFDIVLPVTVANGSLSNSTTTITILQGSLESQLKMVNRTPDTYAAVAVDFGTLPNLPISHNGYVLTKSNQLPLEIYSAINVAPVFTDGVNTTRSIAENTDAGSDIGPAVSATDANNDTLSYSLSGTDAASFDIDSTTGQLQTKVALDYETKDSYSVMITVSDGSFTDSIDVTINITDIVETPTTDETTDVKDTDPPNNAPEFTEGSTTTRSVAENTGSGVNIGNPVSATDEDKDTLTYILGGSDATSFSIGSTNGQLRTSAVLDYETKTSYSVIITVSDDNDGSDTITVTINVSDVEEVVNTVPVFTEGEAASRSVSENTGSGVNIGTAVSATDADNDTLTYSLGGTDAASFSIGSTNGQLRTSAPLDYETKLSYSVTITVSDGNGGSNSIVVTIDITDVDEATNTTPVFTDGSSTSRSIDENTGSGVDIGSAVSATDADNDTLTYNLGGTDGSSFSIDSSSGQLRTSASLDYETKSSYTVTISVSDGNGGSASITVTIDVNDIDESPANNAPVFTDGSSTTRTIAENTATNVNIGSAVSATDADDDTLSYSLSGTDATSFSIDSTNGQLKTNAALNFETKSFYVVTVTASDDQGGSTSINVTINVTNVNEAPLFTAGTGATRFIAENASAGINIGSVVSATDEDGGPLTYTLGGTDAASFDIESNTGQLKMKTALDYETKSSYSVTITVSDGSLTDSIAVTINVRDLDETPSNVAPVFTDGDDTTRTIAENTATNVNIGNAIAATDGDSENIAYLLSGTDASSFAIDGDSGQLKTSAALDYETKTSYEVIVTVSDGTLEDEITVTINVTNVNEAPVFTDGESITRQVDENAVAGTNLGNVIIATDPDADDSITYSLGGTDAATFDIVSTSGQLQTEGALDYETKNSYTVTVIATDTGNATDTIVVTITVVDVNENRAPAFESESTERSVAENTLSGVDIGDAVSATDADEDTLEYSLGGTDAASFSIDSTSGQLRTNAALDYENKQSYTVTISVSDNNGGSDIITVTIKVTDVDENRAPVFTDGESTERSIAENTLSGVDIGDAVSATDADEDTLEYSLGGTDAASFSIDSTSGQLRTNAALDYETKQSYTVTISVSDNNGGTDSITVTIKVTDVDENRAPVFTDGESTERSIAENTLSGVDIGDAVSATDADEDTLEYSLGGTDAASFSIDSTSGQLRTNAALDYETKQSYTVTISVSDSNGGTDSITVTIKVTDVDENRAPVFTDGESVERSIAENTLSGVDIGDKVSATDVDDDTLDYTLGGTDASSFSIDSSSGQLRTSTALNYEIKNSYSVSVSVSDSNGGSDSITVTIKVTDVNDVPKFSATTTTRSIAENTSSGENIGDAVGASDEDDDTLIYSLGGTDASSFDIVDTSGQLQTKAALDYETKTSYSVTVTATDDSDASATIDVTINVTDVNENRAPSFSDSSFSYRISDIEDASVGDSIGDKVTATDADDDTLSYSLGGDDAALFDIDSSSGQLKITQSLIDHSSSAYSIKVIATDPDSATAEISGTIFVTRVAQQNTNNPPVFDDGESTIRTVAENTASGENIGDPVAATDDDTDDTLTYTLEGTDAASFSIVSTSGQLQTSAALDYETTTSYSVTVKVTDDSGASNDNDTIAVTINVTDVTESDTVITPVSNRTGAVRNAIVDAIEGVDAAENVTETQLAAITTLDIRNKNLTGLLSGDFDGLTGLTLLNISSNKFSSLPVDIFDGLTSLTTLYMSFNNFFQDDENAFTTLPDGIFDSLTSLTKLELGYNGLTSLPDGIFDQLTSLELLDLNLNEFTTLSGSVFDGLTSLKTLYLATFESETTNQLTSLGEGIFDDLTSLEHLEMYDHNISTLPDGLFDNTTSLITLLYYSNGTTSLPDGIFDELTLLKTLAIGSNGITSLPDDAFDNNTQLENLVLSYNSISSLNSDVFDELTNLKVLSLEGNELTTLSADIFEELTNLTSLSLSYNSLTSLPGNIFDNNSKLTTLVLENNNISSLPSGLFSELTSLTKLYLNRNNLTSFPDGIFVGLTELTLFECAFQGEDAEVDSVPIKVGLEKVAEGQFKVVCPTGMPINNNRISVPISNGKVHPDQEYGYIVTIDNRRPQIRIPVGEAETDALSVVRLDETTDAVTVTIDVVFFERSLNNYGYYLDPNNTNLPLELIPEVNGAPTNTQLIPEETVLLSNYPNPFNPETWIPYQLSEAADVSLTVYDMRGVVIRKLDLGHKPAGYYTDRKRAAYWDGRNALGEKVAAGVYFTTFKAGDYTATRKMIIRK